MAVFPAHQPSDDDVSGVSGELDRSSIGSGVSFIGGFLGRRDFATDARDLGGLSWFLLRAGGVVTDDVPAVVAGAVVSYTAPTVTEAGVEEGVPAAAGGVVTAGLQTATTSIGLPVVPVVVATTGDPLTEVVVVEARVDALGPSLVAVTGDETATGATVHVNRGLADPPWAGDFSSVVEAVSSSGAVSAVKGTRRPISSSGISTEAPLLDSTVDVPVPEPRAASMARSTFSSAAASSSSSSSFSSSPALTASTSTDPRSDAGLTPPRASTSRKFWS